MSSGDFSPRSPGMLALDDWGLPVEGGETGGGGSGVGGGGGSEMKRSHRRPAPVLPPYVRMLSDASSPLRKALNTVLGGGGDRGDGSGEGEEGDVARVERIRRLVGGFLVRPHSQQEEVVGETPSPERLTPPTLVLRAGVAEKETVFWRSAKRISWKSNTRVPHSKFEPMSKAPGRDGWSLAGLVAKEEEEEEKKRKQTLDSSTSLPSTTQTLQPTPTSTFLPAALARGLSSPAIHTSDKKGNTGGGKGGKRGVGRRRGREGVRRGRRRRREGRGEKEGKDEDSYDSPSPHTPRPPGLTAWRAHVMFETSLRGGVGFDQEKPVDYYTGVVHSEGGEKKGGKARENRERLGSEEVERKGGIWTEVFGKAGVEEKEKEKRKEKEKEEEEVKTFSDKLNMVADEEVEEEGDSDDTREDVGRRGGMLRRQKTWEGGEEVRKESGGGGGMLRRQETWEGGDEVRRSRGGGGGGGGMLRRQETWDGEEVRKSGGSGDVGSGRLLRRQETFQPQSTPSSTTHTSPLPSMTDLLSTPSSRSPRPSAPPTNPQPTSSSKHDLRRASSAALLASAALEAEKIRKGGSWRKKGSVRRGKGKKEEGRVVEEGTRTVKKGKGIRRVSGGGEEMKSPKRASTASHIPTPPTTTHTPHSSPPPAPSLSDLLAAARYGKDRKKPRADVV